MRTVSRIGTPIVLLLIFAVAAFSQTAFDVSKDFRAKLKVMMDAKDYTGALGLYTKLEGGKYELGDAAAQSAASKITGVLTDKGKLFIYLGRYADADAVYYNAFDANLMDAESELRKMNEYRAKAPPTPVSTTLARAAESSAKGALAVASAVKTLRGSAYLLAAASKSAAPFDPPRLAKLKSLQERIPVN